MDDLNARRRDLELGGIEDTYPVETAVLYVPAYVALHEESLHWIPHRSNRVTPKKGLLADFAELHLKSDDAEILDFAKRWGVLRLCRHDLPHTHDSCDWVKVGKRSLCLGDERSGLRFVEDDVYRESIQGWRNLSKEAATILQIAAFLNRKSNSAVADFSDEERAQVTKLVQDLDPRMGIPSVKYDEYDVYAPFLARQLLAERVSIWLVFGGVRSRLNWSSQNRWTVENTPGYLLGTLANSLVSCIVSSGSAVCTECSRRYVPRRRPDPGRQNYCEECRRTAPSRNSQRGIRDRARLGRLVKR
jgi:hypothetical protein